MEVEYFLKIRTLYRARGKVTRDDVYRYFICSAIVDYVHYLQTNSLPLGRTKSWKPKPEKEISIRDTNHHLEPGSQRICDSDVQRTPITIGREIWLQ
jgi:hypothetical protein